MHPMNLPGSSTCHVAMRNALTNTEPAPPPTSSTRKPRRAACDRCRHQKLKCAREDLDGNPSDTGKCNRCTAQRVPCSFSASKRTGRPPASHFSDCRSPTQSMEALSSAFVGSKTASVDVNRLGRYGGEGSKIGPSGGWIPHMVLNNGLFEQAGSCHQSSEGIGPFDETHECGGWPSSVYAFDEDNTHSRIPSLASMYGGSSASPRELCGGPDDFKYPYSGRNHPASLDETFDSLLNQRMVDEKTALENLQASCGASCSQTNFRSIDTNVSSNLGFDDQEGSRHVQENCASAVDSTTSAPYDSLSAKEWCHAPTSNMTAGRFFPTSSQSPWDPHDTRGEAPMPENEDIAPTNPPYQPSVEGQLQRIQQLSELNMSLYYRITNLNPQLQSCEREFSALSNSFVSNVLESFARLDATLKSFNLSHSSVSTSAIPPFPSPNFARPSAINLSPPRTPDSGNTVVTAEDYKRYYPQHLSEGL